MSPVSTRTQRARSFLFARIQPRLHTKEKQAESSIIKDLNNVPWINHNNKATRFKTSANEIDCNTAPIASPLGNNRRNFLSNVNKLFMLTSFAETSSSPRLMSIVFVCILVEFDFHEIMIFFDFHLTPQRSCFWLRDHGSRNLFPHEFDFSFPAPIDSPVNFYVLTRTRTS